ncbi:MAG: phosphonate C-P lyase system protein PhnG [Pseudomonadota bacterium]
MEISANAARKTWLSTLAKADASRLVDAWDSVPDSQRPDYEMLRPAEIGLVMVRGRSGGVGDRFNLGEMTVTRCAVRLASGETGLAWRGGRNKRAAEVAAILDGMLQSAELKETADAIVADLTHEQAEQRAEQARKSGATKVQFFTMTRKRDDKA